MKGQEGVEVEVELSPDELCDFMGTLETLEPRLDNILDSFSDLFLVSEINLKFSKGIFWLPSISSRLRSKRSHFI